jgi:hypothetical protein
VFTMKLSHRLLALTCCIVALLAQSLAAKPRERSSRPKEQKAWVNGRGMCVFPFAADELPDNAEDFAGAMERGYRRALKLPAVDSLRINVSEAIVRDPEKKRNPSKRQPRAQGLDAARFQFLGRGMCVEDATVNIEITASDARLLFTRDDKKRPLLLLGNARDGRVNVEMSFDDVERLLLAAARKGARAYGLSVDRTRLKMAVEDGRTVRVDLKLWTRVGFVPAGLRFRARLDIDDHLNGRLSKLSCTGDEVLGPLISGLIQPFLARYNGKTRPLMNFPMTKMHLRDVSIVADEAIRVSADFGS